MDKQKKKNWAWILNFWLDKFHCSPKCSDQINNQGKVADVITDAVDNESDPREAAIANKKASSRSEGKGREKEQANLSQPVPKATLKRNREIWIECPTDNPKSSPGKGIQEAPGGRIIQFDSVDDKSSCCGEDKKFGEDDSPSTHCLVVNTCCVMSSPTEQGAFISANLVTISKIKKIIKADVFFRLSRKGMWYNLAEIIGEIKRKIIKLAVKSTRIANALGVE